MGYRLRRKLGARLRQLKKTISAAILLAGTISGTLAIWGCNKSPTSTIPSPSISYKQASISAVRNVAIIPDTALSTDGEVISYSVSPSLPAGLILDNSTGIISGIPTVVKIFTAYIVTATGPGGTDTTVVTISVKDVIGMTWTTRTSGTTSALHSVIWTGSQFVAVGDNSGSVLSAILTSPDGVTWTVRNSGTAIVLTSVTWTGSRLVAVGYGVILLSTDGVNWVVGTSTQWSGLSSVIWTGNQLVAVGNRDGTIVTSPDGSNWTQTNLNLGTSYWLYSVIWTGSQFVAVGRYDYPEYNAYKEQVLTSPDGVTWTQRVTISPYSYLNSVIWTGSYLVAVGYYENGGHGSIKTSPDGITWTNRDSYATNGLNSLAWTGNQLVAVGGDNILTSPDGVNWSVQDPGAAYGLLTLYSVAWSGSKLVAVGAGGVILTSP